MFKKILVPLDGSDLAAKILPQVETLAKQTKAQVTLLAVGSSDTCAGGGAPPEAMKEGAACPEFPLARYLEQTAGKLRSQGVEVKWVYKQGNPAQGDRGLCGRERDGSHRHRLPWRRRDRLALGERGQKVIAHAPGAVLIWRVTEPKPPGLKSELYYSMQTP